MNYQYKKIHFDSDYAIQSMNAEGLDGWRVIHVHPNCISAILEKPITSNCDCTTKKAFAEQKDGATLTPTQKRILRDFIRSGGSSAGRKNIPWLESVLGIHIQSETVRGEGTCLYPLCDVDMNVVKATAAKVLEETL